MKNLEYLEIYDDGTKAYRRKKYKRPIWSFHPFGEYRFFYNSPKFGWMEWLIYTDTVVEIKDDRQIKALNKLSTLTEETQM